jgi:hypothetical protein
MGGRQSNPKGADGNGGPGPGAYNGDINVTKSRAPGAGMGKGGRASLKPNDGPGPGDYNVDLKKGGGISMGGRPKDKPLTDGPGPGAYNSNVNNIKESAPGVNFGSPSKGKAAV